MKTNSSQTTMESQSLMMGKRFDKYNNLIVKKIKLGDLNNKDKKINLKQLTEKTQMKEACLSKNPFRRIACDT
jgi:hypothetical protein